MCEFYNHIFRFETKTTKTPFISTKRDSFLFQNKLIKNYKKIIIKINVEKCQWKFLRTLKPIFKDVVKNHNRFQSPTNI